MEQEKFPADIFISIVDEGTEDEFKLALEKPEYAAEVGEKVKVGHYVFKEVLEVEAELDIKVT